MLRLFFLSRWTLDELVADSEPMAGIDSALPLLSVTRGYLPMKYYLEHIFVRCSYGLKEKFREDDDERWNESGSAGQ
jgi:hypothetical protein